MLTRTCDRCKALIPGAIQYWDLWWTRSSNEGMPAEGTVELCEACYTALRRWLKGET